MAAEQKRNLKSAQIRKTVARVFRYLAAYRGRLVLVFLLVVFSAGTGVLGTYFLKPIVDDHIVPWIGAANPDLSGLLRTLFLLAIIYLTGALSTYLYQRLMKDASADALRQMREDMFAKMQSFPLRYFDSRTHGEIMSHYTNDVEALQTLLSSTLPDLISSAISAVGIFVMMILLCPPMAFLVLALSFDNILVTKIVSKRSAKHYRRQQQSLGDVNGYVEELIEGQKVVKVFCHEEYCKKEFDAINETLCDSAAKANGLSALLFPVLGNLGHVRYTLIVCLGAMLTILSSRMDLGILTLGLGSLMAFLQYARSFSAPINQISMSVNVVLNALAGAERIFALMDEEPETDNGYVTLVNALYEEDGTLRETKARTGQWAWRHAHHDGTVSYVPLLGEVTMEDVTFGYTEEKNVLHNINLYAKPGQKVAFVGSTGAGKTTITNLINRFYEIQEGKIRYDGINITKIKKDDLRRSLGMVLQDTHLFAGTVMENIRYGNPDATEEDVIRAAKLANAHWFISRLPKGYQTQLIADGTNLSQGQRQLIAIARAAVADPPVLILDEATSSIDTRTEALIEKGMDELMKGRTVFVIAHRLSTVRNADVIMVLEDGEIIERGSHQQLLEQKGKYYQLYHGMFELS